MVLGAIDIETQGLDATKFIMATFKLEHWKKHKTFYDKNKLWEEIIEQSKRLSRSKKVLNLYAHNHNFDFHGYADLYNKNIRYYCLRPFIASYKDGHPKYGKEIVKFLDSLAIYKFNLKKVGELVNLSKIDTPEHLLFDEETVITDKMKEELEEYCARDTEIVLRAIRYMMDKCAELGAPIKRIYTISQVAGNVLVYKMKQQICDHIFYNKEQSRAYETKHPEMIHQAYRGGSVRAWYMGDFENADYFDCNSLYPSVAVDMRFPDLKSERLIGTPLNFVSKTELFRKIGVSKAMLYNEKDSFGVLPVRTPTGNYFPKKNTYVIGVWTHQELQYAITKGWKLIDIEKSLIYKEGENPFKNIFPQLYKMKKNAKNEIDRYIYKMIMNGGLGKLAQFRVHNRFEIDSVDSATDYLKDNWKIIKGIQTNYIYQKKSETPYKKPYYMPIVPCLINADARIKMYKNYQKFRPKDLLYSDNDSIICTSGNRNILDIGDGLGQFKMEHACAKGKIYGQKTYMIDNKITVSGVHPKAMTPQEFMKGEINYKEMVSIKTADKYSKPGQFINKTRNLYDMRKKQKEIQNIYDEIEIMIDEDCDNINFFLDKIP